MKCHYTYYLENGKRKKVLIPGCWSTTVWGLYRCTCSDITFSKFEKQRYNEKLQEMQKRIKFLEEENEYLMNLIKQTTP